MNTFYQLWGTQTPLEAKAKIAEQCKKYDYITHPANLEEHALKMCGDDIYNTFIKGYTEKYQKRAEAKAEPKAEPKAEAKTE